MSLHTKNAKNTKNFAVTTYNKGFIIIDTTDTIITQEFFQFKEIQRIVLYPTTGVEVIFYNSNRRVFYNNTTDSQTLFNTLTNSMTTWMNLNN